MLNHFFPFKSEQIYPNSIEVPLNLSRSHFNHYINPHFRGLDSNQKPWFTHHIRLLWQLCEIRIEQDLRSLLLRVNMSIIIYSSTVYYIFDYIICGQM